MKRLTIDLNELNDDELQAYLVLKKRDRGVKQVPLPPPLEVGGPESAKMGQMPPFKV